MRWAREVGAATEASGSILELREEIELDDEPAVPQEIPETGWRRRVARNRWHFCGNTRLRIGRLAPNCPCTFDLPLCLRTAQVAVDGIHFASCGSAG